jgi:hypothetical protein
LLVAFGGIATIDSTTGVDLSGIGNLLSDQFFGGGTLQATIEFTDVKESACGLMLFYQPLNQSFIEAQLVKQRWRKGLGIISRRSFNRRE